MKSFPKLENDARLFDGPIDETVTTPGKLAGTSIKFPCKVIPSFLNFFEEIDTFVFYY